MSWAVLCDPDSDSDSAAEFRLQLADSALARAYDVLDQLTPLIMEHQGKGTMKAVIVESGTGSQKVQLGNYVFDLAMGRGWGAQSQTAPVADGRAQSSVRGHAILIQTGPDEFWVAGANLNIRFTSVVAATPLAGLAAVQEGRFENGAWVVGRHLAGDDTGMGGDDRASLRLTANPSILRVLLYSYR